MIRRLLAATLLCLYIQSLWPLPSAMAAERAPAPIVYIVHGYGAAPSDHWFAWLSEQLEQRGIEARVLALPDSQRPSVQGWADYLDTAIDRHDGDSYFVTHSLGCIALLDHLQRQPGGSRVGGAVLVSGFAEALPALPQLDAFTSRPLDFAALRGRIGKRSVIAAQDDPIVPYPLSARLADKLDAKLVTLEQGGHFLASDGFVQLPQALDALLAMMTSSPSRPHR
ncbi:RBBP9/YdeN family alpha/beta hydrolase [Phytopseudomonas dryadis]|nr:MULTISPECIES: alpha/beta hydrolase [Pseudomonas]